MALELILDNSYSQLKGLTPSQYAEVRQLLSYEPDPNAAFFGGFKGSQRRYLIDRKGFFPTGLLSELELFLRIPGIKYTDLRSKISGPLIKSLKFVSALSPYQAQLDAVDNAVLFNRGIISMPTGTGKSLVMALLIDKFKVKTLIVVPTLNIRNQLRDVLKFMFGNLNHITVENIDSSSLKKHTDYDMLIIDEAHHVGAKTYHKLNRAAWTKITRRFFLTATPFRNIEAEQLLFKAIAGEVIFSLSYAEAVEHKYIVPVDGYFLSVPKQKTDANTWPSVYSELVVSNSPRNVMIKDLLLRLTGGGKSTLCLVKEIKHGQILSELTSIPFVCGEDPESKRFIELFNKGEIPGLIGTTGVIGEGIDTKPCEYVIVAGLGKAKSSFMQQVGRCVRNFQAKESGTVILIKDTSHKYLIKHFNIQAKILKEEYSVEVQKLDI